MKKYLILLTVFLFIFGLYTLAFMYSLLSVLLLTTTLFLSVYCFVLSGKKEQLKEMNVGLLRTIQEKNEQIGSMSTFIQFSKATQQAEDEAEAKAEAEAEENKDTEDNDNV